MQGVVTKCLFEMNHQKLFDDAASQNSNKTAGSSKSEGEAAVNDSWLESQIICDRAANVDMENGSEVLSEYTYERDDDNDFLHQEDIDDLYDRQEAYEDMESRLDEDLEPEFRDGENRECLQALAYDRAFVVSGSVIKVYKNGEDEAESNQSRLKYLMHLPVIRD